MELRNAVLVDGARSAFARGGRGKLVATRLDEAGAKVLRGLLDRNPKDLDQFSVASHAKAVAAYEKNIYKDEIIALEVEEPPSWAWSHWRASWASAWAA